MNKIFHVALDSPFFRSVVISNAFVGKEVQQFNWQTARYDYGTDTMRRMCLSMATDFKPDLIFFHCQNPEAFDTETIKSLQAIAPVVNFTFDVRQDIVWHKSIAPLVALTIFACREDVNDCRNDGIYNVGYLPSSADFEFYKPALHFNGKKTNHDIVFIGNDTVGSNLNYPLATQRKDMVEFMYKKFPKEFMAYGMGQKGGFVNPVEEAEIYQNCKIVITHNHFLRSGYCSDRDWRAVGCGALVVHHLFSGIHSMFGNTAVVWSEFSDLEHACEYFLSNTYERIKLAEAERNRVLLNHSWEKRIKEMFKILETVVA